MLQDWQTVDPEQDAVTLVRAGQVPEGWFAVFDGVDDRDRDVTLVHEDTAPLRRMAVFDVLVNNADRKGGHVLPMPDGHRYGVDHGVAFHHEPKLRTVLWGWAGTPLTDEERADVGAALSALRGELGERLREHLTRLEIRALEHRTERLLARGELPGPHGGWPPRPHRGRRPGPAREPPPLPEVGPPVAIHDTASGGLVTIAPEGVVTLYVCGITPYDATHLGHANTYVA